MNILPNCGILFLLILYVTCSRESDKNDLFRHNSSPLKSFEPRAGPIKIARYKEPVDNKRLYKKLRKVIIEDFKNGGKQELLEKMKRYIKKKWMSTRKRKFRSTNDHENMTSVLKRGLKKVGNTRDKRSLSFESDDKLEADNSIKELNVQSKESDVSTSDLKVTSAKAFNASRKISNIFKIPNSDSDTHEDSIPKLTQYATDNSEVNKEVNNSQSKNELDDIQFERRDDSNKSTLKEIVATTTETNVVLRDDDDDGHYNLPPNSTSLHERRVKLGKSNEMATQQKNGSQRSEDPNIMLMRNAVLYNQHKVSKSINVPEKRDAYPYLFDIPIKPKVAREEYGHKVVSPQEATEINEVDDTTGDSNTSSVNNSQNAIEGFDVTNKSNKVTNRKLNEFRNDDEISLETLGSIINLAQSVIGLFDPIITKQQGSITFPKLTPETNAYITSKNLIKPEVITNDNKTSEDYSYQTIDEDYPSPVVPVYATVKQPTYTNAHPGQMLPVGANGFNISNSIP